MTSIINTKVTYIWLLLTFLTGVSWLLPDGYKATDTSLNAYITCGILLLAFFKIRLVIMHFMELIEAPWALRGIFEAWVVVVCSTMIFLYLHPGVMTGFGGL